jgi:hypothetical protein
VLTRHAVVLCVLAWATLGISTQEQCRVPGCGKRIAPRDGDWHHLCREHEHVRRHPPPSPVPPLSIPSPPPALSAFGRPSGCIDQLTLVERAAIVALHGIGWTGRAIAHELHCDEDAVTRWVRRWQETRSLTVVGRSSGYCHLPRCVLPPLAAAIQADGVRHTPVSRGRRGAYMRANTTSLHLTLLPCAFAMCTPSNDCTRRHAGLEREGAHAEQPVHVALRS